MVPEPRLPDALVERVLARLDLPAAPQPDADGLAALYLAWCRQVPWDNVQKRITIAEGRPVLAGAEPVEFFENYLRDGTGGTCWPSSGALHALLVALGFDARRVIGSMHPERSGRRANHGSEIVRADGEEWLVDSSILNERPLPLRRGEVTAIDEALHPMRAEPRDDALWLVTWASYAGPDPIPCLLFEDDVSHAAYLERYEVSRTSGFSTYLMLRKNLAGGVLSLRGMKRSLKRVGADFEEGLVADRREMLVRETDLSPEVVRRIPDDEPQPAEGGSVRSA